MSKLVRLMAIAATSTTMLATGAQVALANEPWWSASGTSRPASLPPGSEGVVVAKAIDVGDEVTVGETTISDDLPAGITAQSVELRAGPVGSDAFDLSFLGTCEVTASRVQCRYPETLSALNPTEDIQLRIKVKVDSSAVSGQSQISVTGGGGSAVTQQEPLVVSSSPTPFGVEDFAMTPEEEGGAVDNTAGSHPFQLTTTLALNQTSDPSSPPALAKDLRFELPPGLVGNPAAVPQCSEHDFTTITSDGVTNFCPADTAIGVATVDVFTDALNTYSVPLFNIAPRPGEPARFGFTVVRAPVILDTAVRSGGDYGVTVDVDNITQLVGFLSTKLTFWGVPGDPRHDRQRSWACVDPTVVVAGSLCNPLELANPPAFLTLPTRCHGPLTMSVEGDSWPIQGHPDGLLTPRIEYQPKNSTGSPARMTGCEQLPFTPSIKVNPDGTAASTPTGLTVDVHVPQEQTLNAHGLAEAAPKNITVALPPGVAVNPSAGDGLSACSEGLVGFTGFKELDEATTATFTPRLPGSTTAVAANELEPLQQGMNFCADAAKIGTVTIKTPILPNPIEGAVYLATQNANPFGSLIALYLVAEDPVSGVVIKLTGNVQLTVTGQLVTTFENSPQAPFEDAELHFFGGERAPLATPARCGPYTTKASMTAWSGSLAAEPESTFSITSGPNGTACPGAALPFSPSLSGGTTNISAGAFSPLTTTIGRADGQQNMQSVQLHMPAGLEGLLAGVKLCDEADANAGTCGPDSQIGETVVSAGVGSDPVTVTGGKVYITEKYTGAPFGLSIVNPVKAGPFDLEHDTANPNQNPACDCVVVRAKIEVDPRTAALTIVSDPSGSHTIPHLIDGIPVQIQKVNVLINRERFTFNPTSCAPTTLTGGLTSDEGAAQPLSVPFQVTNCAALKFAPKFAVSTSGKTSKANGASLTAKLSYPQAPAGTYANIARVKVDLPTQLPSRLTTLQKACTNAQFEANPANCPAASKIGVATVTTPLLPVPLTGPAIFVSHGGEAFPSLTMVLQGAAPYNVTVDLVGTTFISKAGITSTTFKTVPDVPFNTFTLTLPEGKYSALAANGNLCTSKLAMPTEFLAQNGAKINQGTPVAVTGCAKKKTLTRAQKLARALKACERKAKGGRAACARRARKEYGRSKK